MEVSTLTKRFDALGIRSAAESRRAHREMVFTAPDIAAFIGGAILYDERSTTPEGNDHGESAV